MTRSLGRALGAGVAAVAVLSTASQLTLPLSARSAAVATAVLWCALLLAHAALYWFGDRIRAAQGLSRYVAAQGVALFAIVATRLPAPLPMILFIACTAELFVLAGDRWGSIRITLGAIAVYVTGAALGANLYQATTAGLALAATGVLGHAFAALARRQTGAVVAMSDAPAPPPAASTTGTNGAMGLSARETEVLRELVNGARNSDIATQLGITERTVKSHLKSIYQKLGVETRSAAVAVAVQRKLV